jgi:hypothetical protein
MAGQRAIRGHFLVVEDGQPLIAVPGVENGRNVTYYVTDDEIADEVLPPATQAALSAIGAWSDLDWDEAYDALDRIRHESDPTPPLDEPDDS